MTHPGEPEAARAFGERQRSTSRKGPGEAGPLPAFPRQCIEKPYLMRQQSKVKTLNPKVLPSFWPPPPRGVAIPRGPWPSPRVPSAAFQPAALPPEGAPAPRRCPSGPLWIPLDPSRPLWTPLEPSGPLWTPAGPNPSGTPLDPSGPLLDPSGPLSALFNPSGPF